MLTMKIPRYNSSFAQSRLREQTPPPRSSLNALLPSSHSLLPVAYCLLPVAFFLLPMALLPGCERSKEHPPAPASDLHAVILRDPPEGSLEVIAAKKQAKPGDQIVIHGRVAGAADPFVAERAVMTLADMTLPLCSEKGSDGCPTPWDYCCEPPKHIVAGTMTVQMVDATGKPLRSSLKGVGGIAPA